MTRTSVQCGHDVLDMALGIHCSLPSSLTFCTEVDGKLNTKFRDFLITKGLYLIKFHQLDAPTQI